MGKTVPGTGIDEGSGCWQPAGVSADLYLCGSSAGQTSALPRAVSNRSKSCVNVQFGWRDTVKIRKLVHSGSIGYSQQPVERVCANQSQPGQLARQIDPSLVLTGYGAAWPGSHTPQTTLHPCPLRSHGKLLVPEPPRDASTSSVREYCSPIGNGLPLSMGRPQYLVLAGWRMPRSLARWDLLVIAHLKRHSEEVGLEFALRRRGVGSRLHVSLNHCAQLWLCGASVARRTNSLSTSRDTFQDAQARLAQTRQALLERLDFPVSLA